MIDRARGVQIYLSPHLDDAVLSCGGRIWRQTQDGVSVQVITVFAGAPGPNQPLSSFAQELHARWTTPADAVSTRQVEDRRALDVLGAQAVHWRYEDCIYRRTTEGHFAYPDEEALWGPIQPADERLVRELRDRIAALALGPFGGLYVPLAAGGHVDHRIVRRAAEESGLSLTFYEDFPYAQDAESVKTAMDGDTWQVEKVRLSDAALRARIAAIACYRTQVSTFWDSPEQMAESVRAYADRLGAGSPFERYWSVSSA